MKKGPICGTTCMKKSRTYMFQGLTVTLVSHLPHLPCVDTHIPYVVVVTHVRYGPKKKSATYMFQGFPLLVVTHIPYLVVVTLCCSVLQCVAVCYFAILVTHIPYVVVVRQTWDAAVWA